MVKEMPKDPPASAAQAESDPLASFLAKVQQLNEEAKKIPVNQQITIVPPSAKPVVPALNKVSDKSKTIKKAQQTN